LARQTVFQSLLRPIAVKRSYADFKRLALAASPSTLKRSQGIYAPSIAEKYLFRQYQQATMSRKLYSNFFSYFYYKIVGKRTLGIGSLGCQ
jgi:hypothetical protein